MKTITFSISKTHIDHAIKRNAHHCMIADAIKEKFPELKYVHVDLQSVRFSDLKSGKRFKYFTPPEAQSALLAFDQGKDVSPFKMTLSEGKESLCGLAATHPNFKRKAKVIRKIGKKRINPKAERQYGLCAFVK